jgi:hypothetical protein
MDNERTALACAQNNSDVIETVTLNMARRFQLYVWDEHLEEWFTSEYMLEEQADAMLEKWVARYVKDFSDE